MPAVRGDIFWHSLASLQLVPEFQAPKDHRKTLRFKAFQPFLSVNLPTDSVEEAEKKGVAKVKIESRPRRKPTRKMTLPTKKIHAKPVAIRTDPPVLSPP